MVDTAKLRGIIAERGLSQRQVAGMLGMAEKTFYTKMKFGIFGTDEAEMLTDILAIQNPAEIFLAKK